MIGRRTVNEIRAEIASAEAGNLPRGDGKVADELRRLIANLERELKSPDKSEAATKTKRRSPLKRRPGKAGSP